ncbi:MAG: O-antigen translocase [Mariprofundaceae bacterium]|nr:O-antigen translocase [Mariprofundaceae bacterium]
MTLIKTSLLSLIAAIFKISYGLVLNKLLAVYVGPSGVALMGQFQSLQSGLSGIATAGFGQGLTKYLAEYREDVKKSASVFATALKLVCLLLLPVSLGLFFFAQDMSVLLFQTSEYKLWLQGLSISLIPAAVGALLVASLNGLGEIRELTWVGVSSSCLGITIALLCVPQWGVSGIVIALLTTPFLVVILAAWYLSKSTFFAWTWLKEKANTKDGKQLGKFTLMALASAVAVPLSHILIRNYLSDNISMDAAGLWTGMWRISEAYLLVITMTLSVYYLPKLSGLKNADAIKREIKHGQMIILPLVLLSSVVIFLMRDWIIWLLFDDSFLEMRELFLFQMIGDVIKIASWLYAYLMLAKAEALVFIALELLFSALFVVFTILFVDVYGLTGVSYAFAMNYTFYLLFIVVWFYRGCAKGKFDEKGAI